MVSDLVAAMVPVGAAVAIGLTGLAAAIAEKSIGAAAVGAVAENEKSFGKALILTVIPETIVIFGLVIAIMLIGKM